MGVNTLNDQSDGTSITVDDVNQYKSAISGDFYPRNESGAIEDVSGSLGNDSFNWLEALIEVGYWDAGDIKAHHSYNGAAEIGQGWYPCDGSVINETNYDNIHGAGAWAKYIISSWFDSKSAPDMASKYLVGAADTANDGSATAGNTSSIVDFTHGHTLTGHTHKWQDSFNGSTNSALFVSNASPAKGTYNADGTTQGISSGTNLGSREYWTSLVYPTTTTALTTPIEVRPVSVEVIYYIRII